MTLFWFVYIYVHIWTICFLYGDLCKAATVTFLHVLIEGYVDHIWWPFVVVPSRVEPVKSYGLFVSYKGFLICDSSEMHMCEMILWGVEMYLTRYYAWNLTTANDDMLILFAYPTFWKYHDMCIHSSNLWGH